MTSVNLGNTLEYHKIQESLRSENFTDYYLCYRIFLYFFLDPKRYYTNTKSLN